MVTRIESLILIVCFLTLSSSLNAQEIQNPTPAAPGADVIDQENKQETQISNQTDIAKEKQNQELQERVNETFTKHRPSDNEQSSKENKTDEEAVADIGLATILKVIVIFGIMILVLYLIYKFLSKRRGIAFKAGNLMKVMGTTSVALNKYLQLVELEDRIVVIGVAEHSVNLITEIKDKDVIDRIRLNASKEAAGTEIVKSFGETIQRMIGRKSTKSEQNQTDDSENSYLDFVRENSERMSSLKNKLQKSED